MSYARYIEKLTPQDIRFFANDAIPNDTPAAKKSGFDKFYCLECGDTKHESQLENYPSYRLVKYYQANWPMFLHERCLDPFFAKEEDLNAAD